MGIARAGQFGTTPAGTSATDGHGTTHLSVVDRHGNVVAMTSSIEGSMGSFRMTDGFLLNNQLTDFAVQPTTADGPVANRVESRKRPRSAMAPTLVFASLADGSPGDFVMATGSSGGAPIIQHVVKTLIGVLDWGLDAQQAASLLNFGASNSVVTTLGAEHPDGVGPLASGLRTMGHQVTTNAQTSGVASIVRVQRKGLWVLEAGVDPRREGVALGDSYRP
jgi:gamma-glutamyltranspeptidase/glutathione hydrolase